jgi:hypothetical protein
METNEYVEVDQAKEALASVRASRAKVAWSGYPAWYWLGTGAGLGALSVTALLPYWWTMGITVVVGALLVGVARAAGRVRGVREGWACGPMSRRDSLILYGPPALLILAGAATAKATGWSFAWTSGVAAVLVFVLFAGTGLTLGARAAHR